MELEERLARLEQAMKDLSENVKTAIHKLETNHESHAKLSTTVAVLEVKFQNYENSLKEEKSKTVTWAGIITVILSSLIGAATYLIK